MENILHDFNEKVISLVANCLKNSLTEKGISDFTNELERNDSIWKEYSTVFS